LWESPKSNCHSNITEHVVKQHKLASPSINDWRRRSRSGNANLRSIARIGFGAPDRFSSLRAAQREGGSEPREETKFVISPSRARVSIQLDKGRQRLKIARHTKAQAHAHEIELTREAQYTISCLRRGEPKPWCELQRETNLFSAMLRYATLCYSCTVFVSPLLLGGTAAVKATSQSFVSL
jgi:hypothetical protein